MLIQKTRIPLWSAIATTTTLCQQRGRQRVLLRTIIWKQCRFLLTECSRRLTAPKRNYPSSPFIRPCLQKSIVSPMTVCVTSWVKWWLSIPSRSGMNISTPPISSYWQTVDTEQQAAEVRRCSELVLPQAKEPDGKGMMCLARLNPNAA